MEKPGWDISGPGVTGWLDSVEIPLLSGVSESMLVEIECFRVNSGGLDESRLCGGGSGDDIDPSRGLLSLSLLVEDFRLLDEAMEKTLREALARSLMEVMPRSRFGCRNPGRSGTD